MPKTLYYQREFVKLHQKKPDDWPNIGADAPPLMINGIDSGSNKYHLEAGFGDPGEDPRVDTFDYSEWNVSGATFVGPSNYDEQGTYQTEDSGGVLDTLSYRKWLSVSVPDDFAIPPELTNGAGGSDPNAPIDDRRLLDAMAEMAGKASSALGNYFSAIEAVDDLDIVFQLGIRNIDQGPSDYAILRRMTQTGDVFETSAKLKSVAKKAGVLGKALTAFDALLHARGQIANGASIGDASYAAVKNLGVAAASGYVGALAGKAALVGTTMFIGAAGLGTLPVWGGIAIAVGTGTLVTGLIDWGVKDRFPGLTEAPTQVPQRDAPMGAAFQIDASADDAVTGSSAIRPEFTIGAPTPEPWWQYNVDTGEFTWLKPPDQSIIAETEARLGVDVAQPASLVIQPDLNTDKKDLSYGGIGNDTISGGLDIDYLFGQGGDDSIAGGPGEDAIKGGSDNDNLRGGKDSDAVFGDKGSDEIRGGLGTDTLRGGQGSDTLIGGGGGDALYGGNGDDVFYGDLIQSTDGGEGADTIMGAGGVDTVMFNSSLSMYSPTRQSDGGIIISGDVLYGIEFLQFSDSLIAETAII